MRLRVSGWKMGPGMNAQLYTLRDVTRLRTDGWTRFLRTTTTGRLVPRAVADRNIWWFAETTGQA